MVRTALAFCLANVTLVQPAAAQATFEITAEHTGFREYYCVTTGTVRNTGSTTLQDLNGYFVLYLDGEEIGRARGTSFLGLTPGATVEARSEAPNGPCDIADAYHFVVNACMRDGRFIDRVACAAEVTGGDGPVQVVRPRE